MVPSTHHQPYLPVGRQVESTFGTVRHPTRQTKGCGTWKANMSMVFKLATGVEKPWHRLHGHQIIGLLLQDASFVDGEIKEVA